MTWRDLYWKVLRISYIVRSRLFFNSLFLLVWFLFTLNFTITSTIHNYDKNLEKKRTCCSRSIFHHYMFKVIIKILPSVTGDRTKWSSLGFSCVSHFTYQFILHSLLGSGWIRSWAAFGCFSEWIKADDWRGVAWNNYITITDLRSNRDRGEVWGYTF